MAKKMKQYQIVIAIEDKMFFDATNSTKDVNEWLNEVDNAPCSMSVKVFKFDGEHAYELVCEKAKLPKSEQRLIGFCRG